eukprot:TRINITY_DN3908_c0_g1_i2.p1 TRINITY_DN3908_c0_g1~~TRINITY_DN3908_c0_g1_i2.p1  ORF type:complete len:276 (-),score=51.92 TRINITY_DN3908_c0_g1_i2:128-955(-)
METPSLLHGHQSKVPTDRRSMKLKIFQRFHHNQLDMEMQKRLLAVMGGAEVPEEWKGAIPGISYRLGPGFNEEHQGWKVRLVVNNFLDDRESNNVIGIIRGEVEPDRFVVLSNHRDAWGYGAVDPSSGTCAMMESARILGSLVRAGWRPRRSIVFASWAAEEHGIMGSNEWVYDKIHKLMNRAVAVINTDICVSGDILNPSASPSLKSVFVEAIKSVPSTKDSSKSYYEFLKEYYENGETPVDNIEDKLKYLDPDLIMHPLHTLLESHHCITILT